MMTDGCMQLFQRKIFAQHKNDRTIVVVVVVNTAAAILRVSTWFLQLTAQQI